MPSLAGKTCGFPTSITSHRMHYCGVPAVIFVPSEELGRGKVNYYCQEHFDELIEKRVEMQEEAEVT